MKIAIILAAGEGERLQSLNPFKPMIKVGEKVLLEHTLTQLLPLKFEQIHIIFNDKERVMPLDQAPNVHSSKVQYFFKSTASSLHSLYEVSKKLALKEQGHYFISMIDSIVSPHDLAAFASFCRDLKENQSAILTTRFVEDEKPLTVQTNLKGEVTAFQIPLQARNIVTSGVYCLDCQAMQELQNCVQSGVSKMRNFLTYLVEHGHIIKAFTVDKTLDIDRPQDIKSAEEFLGL